MRCCNKNFHFRQLRWFLFITLQKSLRIKIYFFNSCLKVCEESFFFMLFLKLFAKKSFLKLLLYFNISLFAIRFKVKKLITFLCEDTNFMLFHQAKSIQYLIMSKKIFVFINMHFLSYYCEIAYKNNCFTNDLQLNSLIIISHDSRPKIQNNFISNEIYLKTLICLSL